ncbi:molecular chaperone [Pseudomonas stutzeri]|nr:molecular chaperone [Stutzerimonas stutzeri]
MDLHSSYDLLRVTPPDLASLSFAAPQPAAVRAWIAELPKANLGETARRLYTALQELNRLRTPPANRQLLLELLEPETQFVCSQLQKHLRSPVVILDERRQQIAALCQTLQQQLARAAKLTASEALRLPVGDDSRQLCARSLLLAEHALYQMLCQFSLLYTPPTQGFWLELHQLYRVAASRRLERLALPAIGGGEQTIEQCYLASLLLGSARCNQLRQQAIAQLGEALPAWSGRALLREADHPQSLFAFAPATDSPPRYTSLLQEENPAQLLGLDPQDLVRDLRGYLRLGAQQRERAHLCVPQGIGDDLLNHLCTAWSAPAERAFGRMPGSGTLSACLGIRALHYQLAERRSFAETLQLPATAVSPDFQRHERERDPWNRAFDASRNEALLRRPHQRIDYTPHKTGAAEHEQYPCHQLQVINHSPGGYCLAWDDSPPDQLQTGDLIGLQHPGERGWNIAIIRWIRQPRGSGLQLGIELLAPRAQPCGLRPQGEGRSQGQYLRALLLAAIPALGRPALLIAPHLPFQQGQKVLLNLDGREQPVQLTRRHGLSGSFNQFEYRPLEAQPAPPPTSGTSVTTLRLVGDGEPLGFDSLWESL